MILRIARIMTTAMLLLAVTLIITSCNGDKQTVTVPSGTAITVALTQPLSTETVQAGQSFTAKTTEPILENGEIVVPVGATVGGTITSVKKPGSVKGAAMITLDLDKIVEVNGDSHDLKTAPITLKGESDTGSDVERLAAGTVAGAIIGGIAKGGEGAAVGALIGAGAGGTWAVATRGEQIVLDSGQKFRFETTEPARLPAQLAS